MTRLQAELQRLYLLPDAAPHTAAADIELVGRAGSTRTLVLEVARPAGWDALSAAWRGVQADLDLPAPAIAVNGVDGYQLWFSLAQPVPVAQATRFLAGLRGEYLVDVAAERVGMRPAGDAQSMRAAAVPRAQGESGNWSAFLAPDLAPLFAEEPWLDLTPGDDAQADLLSRLETTKPAAFAKALERLAAQPVTATPAVVQAPTVPVAGPATDRSGDPRRFLLDVMNDGSVDLPLRIEAAKALLPYTAPAGSGAQ
jgi:hypothetical protein